MKKNLLSAAIALLISIPSVLAGPAYPGRILVTQPDGSTLGIRLHGDEFFNWATDDFGNIIEQDKEGWWKISTKSSSDIQRMQLAADARRSEAAEMRKVMAKSASNIGSPRIPVILVGFSDKPFSKTAAEFEAMLNSPQYRDNNAIGSVYEYFYENSLGQFTPVFEVLGPVQVDHEMAYYGQQVSSDNHDLQPELALVHAAQKLDGTVDFSQYDNDGNGSVDFVMFYFAGYDQAQGGGTDCIWSHAWYLSSSSLVSQSSRTFDGVKLDRYFCTAELKGASGATMCSIGTTCHEFSHTLGLPDFYDTDYEKNGSAANMYDFDLMAHGSYNGNSTMPPYYTAEELVEVGWLASIPEISESGSVTLPSINYPGLTSQTGYSALKTSASDSGEYFVFEVRGNQRWDAGLPDHGLLVYHVDKANHTVSGNVTAPTAWNRNILNAYSVHPCCYVVPAADPEQTSLYEGSEYLFRGKYLNYSPTAWDGRHTAYQLTDITFDQTAGTVTFNVVDSDAMGISGIVMDRNGSPLPDVTVSAALTGSTQQHIATSGLDGKYSISLSEEGEYRVSASCSGYETQLTTLPVSQVELLNFTMFPEGESLPSELSVFPEDVEWGYWGNGVSTDTKNKLLADLFPSSLMSAYAGKQIKTVSFIAKGYNTFTDCHVVIDFGGERKLALPVSGVQKGEWMTVDVSDYNLTVPEGQDLYIGYGGIFTGPYPYYAASGGDNPGYTATFNASTISSPSSWSRSNMIFPVKITVEDYATPDTGYNHIADPKGGLYLAGDVFALNLVETTGSRKPQSAIVWYLDDEQVSTQTITLTAGSHLIEARFTTEEGLTKVVELPIVVQ